MRLFLLGSTREGQWKCDIRDAARQLGWDVSHHPDKGITTEDVVRLAKGHDLFLWARTHSRVPAGNVRVMLGRLKKLRIPTVSLHLDLYFGVPSRESQIGRDPWWTADYVFTADGGHQKQFKAKGVNHFWCPPAMSSRFFGRGNRVPEFRHAATFTGNLTSIHGQHRRMLTGWATKKYGRRFRRYPSSKHGVYGTRLNDLYASSWVVLGDSAWSPFYWSDRVPTVMGRGGMLAYPRTPGLAEQGFNAENMLLYDRFNFAGLERQIDNLTKKERYDRTEAALTLIQEKHMWTNRLLQIQRTVFE